MAYIFQDYINRISALISDDANKLTKTPDGDLDAMLKQAVAIYSNDKPHYIKRQITSTGATYYNIDTILTDWTHNVSRIQSVEYPIGNTPPTLMEEGVDYYLFDDGTNQDGSSLNIYFLYVPSNGEKFTVEYRIDLTLTRDSTPAQNFYFNSIDFASICFKGAELACLSLASHYAQSLDTTISADSVSYTNMTAKYQSLARDMRRQYNQLVFGSEDATSVVKPAIIDVDIDLPSQSSGGTFLFHED